MPLPGQTTGPDDIQLPVALPLPGPTITGPNITRPT